MEYFFSAIVAISTVVYAILTWRLVSETILLRKAQTEPHIFIIIVSHPENINYLNMIIENIGMGPAYDVIFDVLNGNEIFHSNIQRKLNEISFLKYGIKYMAPQQKIEFLIGDIREYISSTNKSKIEINTQYKNSIGEGKKDFYSLNIDELINYTLLGKFNTNAENYLKIISQSLKDISTGSNRIKVNSYDSKDRAKEIKAYEAEAKEFHRKNKISKTSK